MACCHCAARGGERTQLHAVMRPRRARVRHARHVHSGHVHSRHGVAGSARMLRDRHGRVPAAQHQAARPRHVPGRDQRPGEQCGEQQCCKPAAGEPALGVTVLHGGSLAQIRVVGHARLESNSRLRRTNQLRHWVSGNGMRTGPRVDGGGSRDPATRRDRIAKSRGGPGSVTGSTRMRQVVRAPAHRPRPLHGRISPARSGHTLRHRALATRTAAMGNRAGGERVRATAGSFAGTAPSWPDSRTCG